MKKKGPRHVKRTNGNRNEVPDEFEDDAPPAKWYEVELQKDAKQFSQVDQETLISLRDEAKKCYDLEVTNSNIKNSKSNSNYRWMKSVMAKGTVSDKIAAYVVSIQNNPLCSLEQLRQLISMAKVSKKKECIAAIDSLTELFLSDMLKPNEKLKPFSQRPLSLLEKLSSGNAITRKKYLCYWYFESELLEAYVTYVAALNTMSHDTIDANKEKAVGAMYKLLCGSQEQEKNLLTNLVNKLGDQSEKVASKVIYCLTQLVFKHPMKQEIVLNEVEKLLFRPNISTKAQYYALCFLSQYYLSHENANVAKKLIEVYFAFFKACIKKGDVNSRMMSALLMGVNRAYPYAKLELEKISDHINTIYRVVHVANFNVALHALQLLFQVSDFSNNINDRFYSALYKKLADVKITNTTHQAILLNLIYKAMLKDQEVSRVKTFIKRLLQLAQMANPSFACGLLFLISHVIHKKSDCLALKLEAKCMDTDLAEADEEKYLDVKDEVLVQNEIVQNEIKELDSQEIVDDETNKEDGKLSDNKDDKEATGPGWYHCKIKGEKPNKTVFDPMARNPLYAGGDHTAYVELLDLINHFHPTVSLFATNILKGELIKYSGDPLKDFALIRFLDRFVFKNPKKIEDAKKSGAHPTFGQRKNYTATGVKACSVKSTAYLDQEKKIPVDETFLFNYLKNKRASGEYRNEDDSDELDSVCSEEFEELLDKMASKNKKVDEDDDLDYMNEIGDKLGPKSKRKDKSSNTDLSEDMSDVDELSDLEDDVDMESTGSAEDNDEDFDINDEDKELIGDVDDDDSDIVFDDEEVEGNKDKKMKFENIFASADEFAALLEEEGSSKYAPGSSNAVANKEKADIKQLDWEDKRNRWVQGFNKAIKNPNTKFKQEKRKRFNNKNGHARTNGKTKKRKAH